MEILEKIYNVNETNFQFQYNENFLCLFNKQTGELIIRNFNNNIKTLNINSPNIELNIHVDSVNIVVENDFCVDSLKNENKESIFLNSKMAKQIKNNLESKEWRKLKNEENKNNIIENMTKLKENTNSFNQLLQRISYLENKLKDLEEK